MKKKKETPNICHTCEHCVYIGEGDFICDVDEPVLIIEDHIASDDFWYCGGSEWEPADDDDDEY